MLFPSGIPRFLEILDRILEAGGHNSRPIPEKVPPGACFFREEIEQLLVFENQIDSELPNLLNWNRLLMSLSSGSRGSRAYNTSTTNRAVPAPYT
jgi:hypothetical protein